MIWGVWDTHGGDKHTGAWIKHKEVRILGDGDLVVAPPSIHVETGERYAFDGSANPKVTALPALAPQWLLDTPRLAGSARCYPDPAPTPRARMALAYRQTSGPRNYQRAEVLDAIGDRKLAIAKSWGLVTKSDTPNPAGWVACFVPFRENPESSTPSGSFHFRDGTFQDCRDRTAMSLFDLGASIGPYGTWIECKDDLGRQYVV